MNILPINLDDLIYAHAVESARREFKKTWSEPTLEQTIHSICAFANDFHNLNGGYIIIGIEEQNGLPILPPIGLESHNIDDIQKQIVGNCKRIEPEYLPILSPEIYQDKQILVIWVPASNLRPHHAPIKLHKGKQERAYYVRVGCQTIEAKENILTELMQMTAKVPFDDRRNLTASIDVISPALVRNFLAEIKSDLVAPHLNIDDVDLYRKLRILFKINGQEVPKNVALLFFTHNPEDFFPGARIEVVQFGDASGGDLIEEQIFQGPIHTQIWQVLNYLNALSSTMIRKIPNQAETQTTVAFPYQAMEEAIVNAVYHRSYDGIHEPIKVYMYPDRMAIISYPGPVTGLEMAHFQPNASVPEVPYRNRLLGDFLKALKLAEGRGTGIPKIHRKMNENGSPAPRFEFDQSRTYFKVTLPAHPQYIVIHALRESAHLWAVGERQRALLNLEAAAKRVPKSGAIIVQLIEYKNYLGEAASAEQLFAEVEADTSIIDRYLPFAAFAKILLEHNRQRRASEILAQAPFPQKADELIELAILYKRSTRLEEAHRLFASNYALIKDKPKAVQEYAQTKVILATKSKDFAVKKRLTQESLELFRRAIQLSDDNTRNAWCWYHLAKSLAWLRFPDTDVIQAYQNAISLLPTEPRFKAAYQAWQNKR
jgi:ATP-dependent DNA helicase RecG